MDDLILKLKNYNRITGEKHCIELYEDGSGCIINFFGGNMVSFDTAQDCREIMHKNNN